MARSRENCISPRMVWECYPGNSELPMPGKKETYHHYLNRCTDDIQDRLFLLVLRDLYAVEDYNTNRMLDIINDTREQLWGLYNNLHRAAQA